jgi:hypothetical protein
VGIPTPVVARVVVAPGDPFDPSIRCVNTKNCSVTGAGLHFRYQGFIGVAQSLGDDTGQIF